MIDSWMCQISFFIYITALASQPEREGAGEEKEREGEREGKREELTVLRMCSTFALIKNHKTTNSCTLFSCANPCSQVKKNLGPK